MGLGLFHYIPLIAYIGFWIMCIVSLGGRPLLGLYYMMPFLPYRTLRDHLLDYPLGGKRTHHPSDSRLDRRSRSWKEATQLQTLWHLDGIRAVPLPLYVAGKRAWEQSGSPMDCRCKLCDMERLHADALNFLRLLAWSWKIAKLCAWSSSSRPSPYCSSIDRSFLLETFSRSWTTFDENKRSSGPLGYGSNQTAAFLAQFAMFFWGFGQFLKRRKSQAAHIRAGQSYVAGGAIHVFSRSLPRCYGERVRPGSDQR